MSSSDLVFRIKNYKKPTAEVKLNPEGLKLMERLTKLRINSPNVDPFDYCNASETAFVHAIHAAQMSIGAHAEASEKIEQGATLKVVEDEDE